MTSFDLGRTPSEVSNDRHYRRDTNEGYLLCREVIDLPGIGITYRQLDYWMRCGAIRPAVPARGSGSTVEWAPEQIPSLRFVCCVAALGFNPLVPILSNIWDRLEADPTLVDLPVLFITGGGRLSETPCFGFCIPRAAWAVEDDRELVDA